MIGTVAVYCIMQTTVMIQYFDNFQFSLDCIHSSDPTQERMKNRTSYITDVSTFSVTDVTPDPTDSSCLWSIVSVYKLHTDHITLKRT